MRKLIAVVIILAFVANLIPAPQARAETAFPPVFELIDNKPSEGTLIKSGDNENFYTFDSMYRKLIKRDAHMEIQEEIALPAPVSDFTVDGEGKLYAIISGKNDSYRIYNTDDFSSFTEITVPWSVDSTVYPYLIRQDGQGNVYIAYWNLQTNLLNIYKHHADGTYSLIIEDIRSNSFDVDANGAVYVGDRDNFTLNKITDTERKQVGGWGNELGQFADISSVFIDLQGYIHVIDSYGLTVLDPDFVPISRIGPYINTSDIYYNTQLELYYRIHSSYGINIYGDPSIITGLSVDTPIVERNELSTVTASIAYASPYLEHRAPKGEIAFYLNAELVEKVALDQDGTASTSAAIIGQNSEWSAIFFEEIAGSGSIRHEINSLAVSYYKVPSSIKIEAEADEDLYINDAVVVTAYVTAQQPDTISPTGNVQFYINDATSTSYISPLNEQGEAAYTFHFEQHGDYKIEAEYLGDESFDPSSDVLEQRIYTTSTTTLSLEESDIMHGDNVTVKADVKLAGNSSSSASGKVKLYHDRTLLDVQYLNADGTASFIVPDVSLDKQSWWAEFESDSILVKNSVSNELQFTPKVRLDAISFSQPTYTVKRTLPLQMLVTAEYSDQTTAEIEEGIEFTSSDPSIVVVNEQGKIVTKGTGQAIVTAYFAGKSASTEIVVAPNDNANLSDLDIAEVALTFDPAITEYNLVVKHAINKLTLTALADDLFAAISIHEEPPTHSEHSYEQELVVGDNVITIRVTAEDGVTTNDYTIKVKRSAYVAPPASTEEQPTIVEEDEQEANPSDQSSSNHGFLWFSDYKPLEVNIVTKQGVSYLQIDDALEDMLSDENQNYYIHLSSDTPSYQIALSANFIHGLTENANIALGNEDVSYELPMSWLKDKLSEYAGEASVKLIITKLPNSVIDQQIAPAYSFEMVIEDEAEEQIVSFGNKYVKRSIALNDSALAEFAAAVTIVNHKAYPIPFTIEKHNNRYYAVIMSSHHSVYTVIEHKVNFLDIDQHWARASIESLGKQMIINGITKESFEPNSQITRAQFASLLARVLGFVPNENQAAAASFVDTQGKWYDADLAQLKELQIITGYANGEFRGEELIKREEIAVLLDRILGYLHVKLAAEQEAPLFSDHSLISTYAVESVNHLVQRGLLQGFEDGSFRPDAHATRAEAASVLMRLKQYIL